NLSEVTRATRVEPRAINVQCRCGARLCREVVRLRARPAPNLTVIQYDHGGARAMQGSLGEKIGEGAMADVHAWAPGQVLKLFKVGIPGRIAWYEAHMTRAVFAAGGPAPEVLDEVKVEGRRGIVLPRLDGPTLLRLLQTDAIT